ncbi:uncharacterized protein OCT59_018642 [Rhizophagus irregularis]|uniref:Uncharacterized protein n=2 Tax=Rhizophagus irregularis TaxID=588596 RepID=U9SS21_RHIID|nr:hypothetical protein GLOIN_2v1768531 [Rhizophagus irregularis DAOM 181602=DAOM 197198]EXX50685.1 hypothetical protein RirG_268400 [Rhizophagus irregularis DAOM 197198w]POG76834.1 hypothetical protein GLOIN_2v1768531 [Rhizophagus irregularis DAOM 181602=DAOM 197198]UZO26417.1 hypothetical protein OCT59_018642 [Rhizophagus irregularis]|eukprot:XP_025183700.1 hypothetical protein GLOIN_2v1768531 [Rhizophagus irregularis DAOM 181602=DAOM 197198]
MNKILVAFNLKEVEPVTSVQFKNFKDAGFPIWSSFVCGENLTKLTVQVQTFNIIGEDIARDISNEYIRQTTASSLLPKYIDTFDERICFVFEPRNEILFKAGEIDQIYVTAFASKDAVQGPISLIFGIFNEDMNASSILPFFGPSHSINRYSFTRSERLDVENILHSYFSVNLQSSIITTFANEETYARFLYSPDSYLVTRYVEKVLYTPNDLISAIGGLITYALTAWFILFGRGKYRSWGWIQRYLLCTSPNINKNYNRNQKLPIAYEKPSIIESQINNDTLANSSQVQLMKDLNEKIDKINQKLRIFEQILSCHYLSGFRLHDFDSKELSLDSLYDKEERNNNTNHSS